MCLLRVTALVVKFVEVLNGQRSELAVDPRVKIKDIADAKHFG